MIIWYGNPLDSPQVDGYIFNISYTDTNVRLLKCFMILNSTLFGFVGLFLWENVYTCVMQGV